MKTNIGLILVIVALVSVVAFQSIQNSKLKNDVQFWSTMADIMEGTLYQERLKQDRVVQERAAEYIKTHNGSAPPASWYPNGDPWRNFTAEEANKMLKDCENP